MPRILIVSPHFPPVNAPDMQRVRMSLPHFIDAGWEIVVLAADDRAPAAPVEPDLLATVPGAVRVVRARAWSRRWTRWLGLNNLGWRVLVPAFFAGRRLLREGTFDLVYFSTTQFVVLPLGRIWRRSFGVPYVVDLQDPWLNEYYHQPGAPRPPGGWKYFFAHQSARLLEGWTLSRAAHVISVSAAYLDALARRYAWFRPASGSVLTFGAPDADFAVARRRHAAGPPLLPPADGLRIAYAGRLGADMLGALDHLFAALARLRTAGVRVTVFFHGTSYAAAGSGVPTTTAAAARHGLADQVREDPARIGYLDSLRLLLETDVALVLGSADAAYSPSKLYPSLLAGRPVLAIAPAGSVLAARVAELGGAALVTFRAGGEIDAPSVAQLSELLGGLARGGSGFPAPPPDLDLVRARYSAAAVAVAQLEIFNAVIRPPTSTPGSDRGDHWVAPQEAAPE